MLWRAPGIERWLRVVLDGELHGLSDEWSVQAFDECQRHVDALDTPAAVITRSWAMTRLFAIDRTVTFEFVDEVPVSCRLDPGEEPAAAR